MRYKKTPVNQRTTYKLFDENGEFITEYRAGENGVTIIDIQNLHKIDDHEVYVNCKERKLPEWYKPVFEKWKEEFIKRFEEEYGRKPYPDEIPYSHRLNESLEDSADEFGEYSDKSYLQAAIAVTDEDDTPDSIFRLRELVAEMPEQWQKVYELHFIENLSKAEVGRKLGISDVRVGQLVNKIKRRIAEDKILKNFFI